jgi:hypothetical protein
MDQTKFINTYIANLAEKLKGALLDNIVLTTQLNLATETIAELNETIVELTSKLAQFNDTTPPENPEEAEVLPLSDYK